MNRTWIAARWITLVAASVLWNSCGSGASTSITQGRALAYARSVNLQASDVPGMKSFTMEFVVNRSLFGSNIERCSGMRDVRPILSANSPRFRALASRGELKSEVVRSTVQFVGSDMQARQDVAILGSAQFRRCLERYRASEAANQPRFHGEVFKEQIEVASLPASLPGLRAFGQRVSGTLAAAFARSKTRRAYFEDILGFAAGPAVIILRAEGTPRPVLLATERRLFRLLEARAKAHQI